MMRAIFIATGAAWFLLASGEARAERVYFLVGVRHVYRIGLDRDLHLAEREEIEKNYADGIAADQDVFNKHVAAGADRVKESEALNADLDALAEARDKSLGSIFERRDDIRARHPELQIKGDGPYQVMGIEMHDASGGEVFDRFVVYAPWPGYVPYGGVYYGGWEYGVWYEPSVFFGLYLGWFDAFPVGRYYGGFFGHAGPVVFAPRGFVGGSGAAGVGAYAVGRLTGGGSAGYSHYSAYNRTAGYSRANTYGRAVSATGYSHSLARSATRSSTGSTSGYSHSHTESGTGRSAVGAGTAARYSRSDAGGYAHSASGAGGNRSSSGNLSSHSSGAHSSGAHSRSGR